MKRIKNLFSESNEELLLRKFRVLVREKKEMIGRGDMRGYAHAVARAELVARKLVALKIK